MDKKIRIKTMKKAFKELKLIELLKDIEKYSYNSHCDCPTCIDIKNKIKDVLKCQD